MLRLFKTLLLSLLMFALPVQGLAAAIGTSCGQAHRHDTLSAALAQDHEFHGHQHFAGGHHDAMAEGQSGDMHSHPPGDTSDSHASASSCSACAACCVGAVIPASALNHHPNDQRALAPLAEPPTLLPGVIPEGPKRPPRTPLV